MVKAARSRGCRTCVNHHIKCDETRPACLYCKKRGLECPGYGIENRLRDEGPKLREKFEIVSRSSVSPRELPAGALWQEHLFAMCSYQITGPPHEFPGAARYLLSWLYTLLGLSPVAMPSYLKSAIRAITLSMLSNGSSFAPLGAAQAGHQYYTTALRQLAWNLGSARRKTMLAEKLATAVLLTYHDMFSSIRTDDWIKHAIGAAALIRAGRPEDVAATTFLCNMFMSFRPTIIVAALIAGTPCFLADAQWRAVAEKIHHSCPASKKMGDVAEDMYAEMATLPGLVAEVERRVMEVKRLRIRDYISSHSRTALLRCLLLLARLIDRRFALQCLYNRLIAESEKIAQAPIRSTASASNNVTSPFPKQLSYRNHFVGSTYCAVWALQIILNAQLASLHMVLQTFKLAPKTRGVSIIDQLKLENVILATAICNSANSMSDSTLPGSFFLSFGLKAAYGALEDCSEKQKWVEERLGVLGRFFGPANLGLRPGEGAGAIERLARIEYLGEYHPSEG